MREVLGIILALCLVAGAGGFVGNRLKQAEWDRSIIATKEAQDKALDAAAKEIAQIEVKNVTIRQEAKTIMRDVPVYRECVHDGRVFDRINAAIESTDSGKLPEAGKAQ